MKKAIAIVLSFLLILSTSGFQLSAHYCGETLVEWSTIGLPACGMEKPKADDCNINKPNCCSDVLIQIDALSATSLKEHQKQKQSQDWAFRAVAVQSIALVKSIETESNQLPRPPLIEEEFPVLFQSFLL